MANDLVSKRVIVGRVDQRLADLAATNIQGTHHCIVLDEHGRFVGLIQLAELLSFTNASNRLLGDLISRTPPVFVKSEDTVEFIAELFDKFQLSEAVLIDSNKAFLGLITAQTVADWNRRAAQHAAAAFKDALVRIDILGKAKVRLINAVSHELRTPLN